MYVNQTEGELRLNVEIMCVAALHARDSLKIWVLSGWPGSHSSITVQFTYQSSHQTYSAMKAQHCCKCKNIRKSGMKEEPLK